MNAAKMMLLERMNRGYDQHSISHEMQDTAQESWPRRREDYETPHSDWRAWIEGTGHEQYEPIRSGLPIYYENRQPMRRIGFSATPEIGRNYRSDLTYNSADEIGRSTEGTYVSGHADGTTGELTQEMAEEWTHGMKNADGTTGPHWTMDQAAQVMGQYKIHCAPEVFYAVLNSVYSDYCNVAKKHNVNTIGFYADMAKAWLEDDDAVENKAAAYFESVVKR